MSSPLTRLVSALCLAAGAAAWAADADECRLPSPPWQLERLLPEVGHCNRDVLAARIQLEAATADVRVARQKPNPTLTLGVSNINPRVGIGGGTLMTKTVDSSVRIDQVIERGGKAGLRVDAAGAAQKAVAADLETVLRQQQASFIKAWHAAVAARERLDLLQELLALGRQTEQLAAKRVQAGDLPVNDLTRISLDTLRAENDMRQAEADWRQARLDLVRLLGLETPPDGLALEPAWPALAVDLPPTADSAVEARPDITAYRLRVDAARAARDLAKAQAREDVSVGLQVDHWPTSPSNQQGTGNSLGVSLSIPIELRHRHEGEIQRGEADFHAASDALASARLAARNDLAAMRAAVEASRRRLESLQTKIIPASEQIAARAELAYNKGASSVLDLLDSRRSLRQVSLDGVSARLDYAQSLVDWQLAAGGKPADLPAAVVASPVSQNSQKESR